MIERRVLLSGMLGAMVAGCASRAGGIARAGDIERLDAELDTLIALDARVEIVARGYEWAEGPVWAEDEQALYFSDVPGNVVHRWTRAGGAQPWLSPSGLAGPVPTSIREAGANGLALDATGAIVMGDSGSRTVAKVDRRTRRKTVLAERFEGKRFNSPNDIAIARDGTIYFTDPPYGLQGGNDSPLKELPFNGVFRLDRDGRVTLLDDSLSFPNGIGLSPDERTLYVAISDRARPELLAYPIEAARTLGRPRVLAEFSAGMAAGEPGAPDGLKVHPRGHIFATGPGGVHIIASDGRRLGRIRTDVATANCAFGEKGRALFLTSDDRIARVPLV